MQCWHIMLHVQVWLNGRGYHVHVHTGVEEDGRCLVTGVEEDGYCLVTGVEEDRHCLVTGVGELDSASQACRCTMKV